MFSKALFIALLTSFTLQMSGMQQPPALVLPPGPTYEELGEPEIIIDVVNNTANNYVLYSDSNLPSALKAGQSKRLNLTKEWKKIPVRVPAKKVNLYLKDNAGNMKLQGSFKYFNGYLSADLNGDTKSMESFSLRNGKPGFLVRLGLKGANLEQSIPDITVSQQ